MHAYSGSAEMVREVLDLNFYVAFGGVLTFKNARKTVEAAEKIPLDRLLIETDCPYMTPTPFRGKRNHPKYVRFVAEKLAEVKGVSAEKIAEITYQNGKKLFHID